MKGYLSIIIFSLATQHVAAQVSKENDDSLIRASRARTNELIASHDVRGLARYWLNDYIRVSGNGTNTIGRDSALAFWTRTFKQQPTIYYVRTPTGIIISEDGLLAWETGTWTGKNTKSKAGNYSAIWSKQDNIWKLQSELYITLSYY